MDWTSKENYWKVVLLVVTEAVFGIDFILNFFIVPKGMNDPKIKRIACNYFKTFFVFDLIATVVSNVLLLVRGDMLLYLELKLLRIVRFRYIVFTYA